MKKNIAPAPKTEQEKLAAERITDGADAWRLAITNAVDTPQPLPDGSGKKPST